MTSFLRGSIYGFSNYNVAVTNSIFNPNQFNYLHRIAPCLVHMYHLIYCFPNEVT
jgi:hypothetical protein